MSLLAALFLAQAANLPTIPYTPRDRGTPFENAGAFMRLCEPAARGTGPGEIFGMCFGYLQGLIDRDKLLPPHLFCIPSVSHQNLMKVVIEYLHRHPETHTFQTDGPVMTALREQFPDTANRRACAS